MITKEIIALDGGKFIIKKTNTQELFTGELVDGIPETREQVSFTFSPAFTLEEVNENKTSIMSTIERINDLNQNAILLEQAKLDDIDDTLSRIQEIL